jgi:hypothetical protein
VTQETGIFGVAGNNTGEEADIEHFGKDIVSDTICWSVKPPMMIVWPQSSVAPIVLSEILFILKVTICATFRILWPLQYKIMCSFFIGIRRRLVRQRCAERR